MWYLSLRCIPYYRYDRYNWAWYYRPLVLLHHLFQGSMNRHLIKLKNKKRKVVIFFQKTCIKIINKNNQPNLKNRHSFIFIFLIFWYNWALYYVSLEKKPFMYERFCFIIPWFTVYILLKSLKSTKSREGNKIIAKVFDVQLLWDVLMDKKYTHHSINLC